MNCREFITEFEERRALTEAAKVHLSDCPDCVKTSGAQTRVWAMIDGLNRLGAPKDFDFRVKARIANARPADFQPRFLPVLRYVLPLLIIFFGGLIALNVFYFSSNVTDDAQLAKDTAPQTPDASQSLKNDFSNNQIAVTDTVVALEEKSDITVPVNNTKLPSVKDKTNSTGVPAQRSRSNENLKARVKDEFKGSRTTTFRAAKVFIPENFNANRKTSTTSPIEPLPLISVEEIGKFIGIEMNSENGKHTVKSVAKNSAAERSGIKVGDVIEKLNGEKLSGEPLRFKTIEAKTVTVTRASEKVEINLQN